MTPAARFVPHRMVNPSSPGDAQRAFRASEIPARAVWPRSMASSRCAAKVRWSMHSRQPLCASSRSTTFLT